MPNLVPLVGATNALLGAPGPGGRAMPKGSLEDQARAFLAFWESIEVQRLMVEARHEWETRFTHPLTNAMHVAELLALPGYSDQVIWTRGVLRPRGGPS